MILNRRDYYESTREQRCYPFYFDLSDVANCSEYHGKELTSDKELTCLFFYHQEFAVVEIPFLKMVDILEDSKKPQNILANGNIGN